MRWLFAALPWELLGPRLAMLSLTYPGEWREWLPDGRALDGHRRAFLERWRRRWGAPVGVWVKEFQASGRPHLHLYWRSRMRFRRVSTRGFASAPFAVIAWSESMDGTRVDAAYLR